MRRGDIRHNRQRQITRRSFHTCVGCRPQVTESILNSLFFVPIVAAHIFICVDVGMLKSVKLMADVSVDKRISYLETKRGYVHYIQFGHVKLYVSLFRSYLSLSFFIYPIFLKST